MAKNKTTKPLTARATKAQQAWEQFDLDQWIGRYIWVLIPVLVMLYYLFSQGSTGFYQDDEIGHYRNIRQFFGDPFSIMGNQPKPGWKILMVLPSMFGVTGVLLAHCLMAALTVVATYHLGRAMKLRNASVGALLLAAQPLFIQLSFRTYSEITAGLFVVLMLLFYQRRNHVLAAIFSSYIFSIRQEFALVTIVLGVIFLVKRRWVAFLVLGWTPLVLALIGWLSTGNMMWLIDDMRKIGLGVEVPHQSFWHYFGTYIHMVGPVSLALLVVGYWSFLNRGSRWREALQEHGFVFFTYTVMWAWAVISAWDVPNFGANPGHWRYMLSIAPLTAIYVMMGINVMLSESGRRYSGIVLGVFTFITLVLLSREADGFKLLDKSSYTNFFAVFGVLVIFLASSVARILKPGPAVALVTALGVVFTMATITPLKLNTEAETVKEAAQWYGGQGLADRRLLCNHVLFSYFSGIDVTDRNRGQYMSDSTIRVSPAGTLIVWDSHYGNNQFGGDVDYKDISTDTTLTLLKEFLSRDQTFYVGVFEKR